MIDLSTADVEKILINIHYLEQIVNAAKQKRDDAIAYFKQLISNAQSNFETDTADANIQIDILTQKLKAYFDAHPPTKAKSLKFAGGSFGYNKASTKFYRNGQELNADNQDLLFYLDNNHLDHYIKVKRSVDWANLKKDLVIANDSVCISSSGEILDGVVARKFFSVKTA